MYRLLIVEDEDIIREGLVSTIDWAQWGFAVCGTATDGAEGLAMTACLQPELVLTDIRMPRMNGLELLRRIKAAWPHIEVIMLTGHEQFDYAFEGLNLQAAAYVLKIDIRRSLGHAMETVLQRLAQGLRHPEQAALAMRALTGYVPEPAEPAADQPCIGCLQAYISAPPDAEALREDALADMTAQVKAWCPQAVVIRTDAQTVVFLRIAGDAEPLRCGVFTPVSGVDVQFVDCGVVRGYAALAHAASAARATAQRMSLTESSWQVVSLHAPGQDAPYSEAMEEAEEAMLRAVDMLDVRQLEEAYARWHGLWFSRAACFHGMQARALRLMGTLSAALSQGAAMPDVAPLVKEQERYALSAATDACVRHIAAELAGRQGNAQAGYIAHALAYVEAHLHERVRIGDIASALHLNPSYLSVLFKEHTGRTFTDYMLACKMQQATALLRGGESVARAAAQVGYADVGHFRAMYQRVIGQAPGSIKKEQPDAMHKKP